MMQYIISITGISFLLGAAAVAGINRMKEPASRIERWVKYFTYLAIVMIVGASIIAGHWYFIAMAAVISVVGFYEVINTGLGSGGSLPFLARSVIVYIALLFCFLGFAIKVSAYEILIVYFIVILFDGFSQLSGQLFGKRKLAPVISPNKTIEGALGGLLFTMLFAWYIFIKVNNPVSVLFLICPAALAGDLLASWYKRKAGVKDYSNLIPGHGGVLDRFDSFIAAGASYFLFKFIFG